MKLMKIIHYQAHVTLHWWLQGEASLAMPPFLDCSSPLALHLS